MDALEKEYFDEMRIQQDEIHEMLTELCKDSGIEKLEETDEEYDDETEEEEIDSSKGKPELETSEAPKTNELDTETKKAIGKGDF